MRKARQEGEAGMEKNRAGERELRECRDIGDQRARGSVVNTNEK